MSQNITPHNPLEGQRAEMSFNLHDGSEEQVSIIVVHRNRPEYLNICLQSIAVTSTNNNYEIIVVDNDSNEESQEFLTEIENDVKVIRNREPPPMTYWAPAANKGAAAADKASKYFIFMHCDVVVLNPAWIDLLVNVSEAQKAGMVGVELQSYFMQQERVDFIQEYCLLMTRDCFEDIGPFPEKLPQIGHSFIMTVRAQHRGWVPQVMRNPIVHHYKNFALDINEFERLTEQAMVTIPGLFRQAQELSRRV